MLLHQNSSKLKLSSIEGSGVVVNRMQEPSQSLPEFLNSLEDFVPTVRNILQAMRDGTSPAYA